MRFDELPPILTTKKMAEVTGNSLPTINRMIKSGKIKAYRDGRSVKIDTQSVIDHYSNLPLVNDHRETK
jgi:excisionase family DNA binding protein